MAKVTVILTSYNHAKYLREAIDSVLNQTFTDFTLIIGDDASTDDSWNVIQSYDDPRIRAFRHESNRGGGIINELLLSGTITSDYLAIHHSDDAWAPEKLEKQVACLETRPELGAVFTWAKIIDENGLLFQDESHFYYTIFEQPNRSRYEWLNYFFYRGNALCHPSVLIRKRCYDELGSYRYGLNQLGDFDLWVRLCFKYEIHVLPEKLVYFRVRAEEANTSANLPDVQARLQFEYFQILHQYLHIQTPEEFQKIFPESVKYLREVHSDLGFALAMAAFEAPFDSSHLFGLQLLFMLLNDSQRKEYAEKTYGFTIKDYYRLNTDLDVFSARLRQYTVPQLKNQLAEREAQLRAIYASRTWKVAWLLRKFRLWCLPVGSRREALGRFVLHTLRAIKERLLR